MSAITLPVQDQSNVISATFRTAATSRGTSSGRVSSEWFSRPADQRYLSLSDLYNAVRGDAENSKAQVVESNKIRVVADRNDGEKLALELPDGSQAKPTHWSFSQACGLVKAPAGYLRTLPAALAAINLQYGLSNHRAELVKTYSKIDGTAELRAITGPDYGRIHDFELVQAIMAATDGGPWKVPGVIDWASGSNGTVSYNPFVDVTKETTTLFASDRDVFIFLVDDTHPIEIGKLPDGSPDLVFRGFYSWNSEVGSKTQGFASFLLRGVCQNRCIWGMEQFEEVSIRHSKNAPARFAAEAAPALLSYATASPTKILLGIRAAKNTVVAKTDEDRSEFLTKRGLSKTAAQNVIDTVLREEGKAPESVWDFVQGLTAVARSQTHQDARIEAERFAGKLMEKVAA